MRNKVARSRSAAPMDRVATKRDIQALAMGMAANIDNLAVGLSSAVKFMQKQQRLALRELARQSRRRAA